MNNNESESAPTYKKTLRFHSDTISGVCFNPNNKSLISGSNDNSLLIWNLESLAEKPRRLTGHKSLVNDIAVSPSGEVIASASSDHTVRIWSEEGPSSSFTSFLSKNNSAPVKSVDFSCDSRLLVTGSDDKTVKIINVGDRKMVASLSSHSNWVKCVRFSMDARLVASSSDDKTVKLWDVSSKMLNCTFSNCHSGVVNSVRFHPDNSIIGTACFDKKVRLFDVRSKTLVQVYGQHRKPVTSLAFHPHGTYLASTSYDEDVRIFDIRSGRILYTLSGHQGATTAVNFSHYGDYFATGGQDGLVVLWTSNMESEDRASDKEYYTFPIENDKNIVATSSENQPADFAKNSNQKDYLISLNSNKKAKTSSDSATEELAKVFEKMVYQLELVTSTFQNFENRLSKVEDLLEYIRINPELAKDETNFVENLQNQRSKLQQEIYEAMDQATSIKERVPNKEYFINTLNAQVRNSDFEDCQDL